MTNYKVGDEVIYTGGYRYGGTLADKTPKVGAVGIIVAPSTQSGAAYLVAFPGVGNVAMGTPEIRLKNDPEERRFIDALDMIEAKTGSPGLTSWSDGKVGMTLSEFERLAGLLPEAAERQFETGEVVYFVGYRDGATQRFSVGDTLTIMSVDANPRGTVRVHSIQGSVQRLYPDEISRTKP